MSDEPAPDPQPDPEPAPDPEPDPEPEAWDEDRAKATIKKQRESEAAAIKRAKELEAKVKEYEDSTKTEQEKLTERTSAAEKDATEARAEAARLRVALRKGLTETQAKRLVGETEEDLEADADELLESFKSDDDGQEPKRRPRERLRPGAAPSADAEPNDPAKLAEGVSRGW